MRRYVLVLLVGLGLSTLGQGCALERYGSGERNAGRPTEAGAGGGTAGSSTGGAGNVGAGEAGAGAGGAGAGGAGAGGEGGAGASGAAGQSAGGAAGAGGFGATSGSSGAGGAGAGGAGGGAGGASGQGGDAGQAGAGAGGAGAGGAGAGGAGAGGAGAGGAGASGAGAGGAGQGGSAGAGCVLFTDPCDADCDGHMRADPVACPGGDDCCDADADVFAGQTKWFTTASACGSFDYDCNTKEDQRTGQGSKCVGCNFLDCCHTPGYEGTPPACGQSGATTGCKAFCAETDTSQVQECH